MKYSTRPAQSSDYEFLFELKRRLNLSQILTDCLAHADKLSKPVESCYLQGNRVGELYLRFGFEITSQNDQFVYMWRQ